MQSDTELVVERLLQRVCDSYAFSGLRDGQLRQALVRDTQTRLEQLRRAGSITRFIVRCDDETNEGQKTNVVVEVHLFCQGECNISRFVAASIPAARLEDG